MEKEQEQIIRTEYSDVMQKSYIDYAMSVIISRALPDVRDGLKPVQRRTLYDMYELGIRYDRPYRKSARIVGDTMGKYHPHGDSSIYEALVKLAQSWNTRYPLVDGHGNFGSVDGDGAAAMRYTEARLSKISMEMLADIKMDTVDFIPNFDETEKEPVVMPSRYPNLLVNGTGGIAVGMATNIPPHNLKEVIDAVVKIIDNKVEEDRDTDIDELMEIIKGPDFPTGAIILGRRGIEDAYRTGRGKIKIRSVTDIEPMSNGKQRIVVTELPYMVNKARLIQNIAQLVKDKKIDGITDLRDESSREGMRIAIELRKDANANVILNQLYKHTQLQDSFGVIMLALVDGQPKVLNLLEMLEHYLDHQKDVVTRRTRYELDKAEKRAHILEGLLIALDHIDRVIEIIRSSKSVAEAKEKLVEEFKLTEVQAEEIVNMRLRALTGLEREKLENEYKELMAKIEELKAILADEKKLLTVIKEEILVISAKYGDERRTQIGFDDDDITIEDMIPKENVVITMSNLGFIKRMTVDNFNVQHRGGKGIKGMSNIEDDFTTELFMTTTHHYLMFFTNLGRAYRIKAYEIPEASRTARGTAIVNLLQLQANEYVTAGLALRNYDRGQYLFFATKNGIVKKTPVEDYSNVRKATDNTKDILMVTKKGMCIRFNEKDVRCTGRNSQGVIGMDLNKDDEVIGVQMDTQGTDLLIVSENGLGKRTSIDEFTTQRRGGKGVKCYKVTDKTGNIVGMKNVNDDNEIMLISTQGIVIRMECEAISRLGRNTSGVKLMRMDESGDIKVASITKVREKPADFTLEEKENESDDSEPTGEELTNDSKTES